MLRFAPDIRPQDRPSRAPAQEAGVHQRVQDVPAVIRAKIPQTHGLSDGQFKARHFFEVASNTIDDQRETHWPSSLRCLSATAGPDARAVDRFDFAAGFRAPSRRGRFR